MKVIKLLTYLALAILLPVWLYLSSNNEKKKNENNNPAKVSIGFDKSTVSTIGKLLAPNPTEARLVTTIEKLESNQSALVNALLNNKPQSISIDMPKIIIEDKYKGNDNDNDNELNNNILEEYSRRLKNIEYYLDRLQPSYQAPEKKDTTQNFKIIEINRDKINEPMYIREEFKPNENYFFGIKNNTFSTVTILRKKSNTDDSKNQNNKNQSFILNSRQLETDSIIPPGQIKLFQYKINKLNNRELFELKYIYDDCRTDFPIQIVFEKK